MSYVCVSDKSTWFKEYEELKKFRSREGHWNFSENESLWRWVSQQREQYRYMKEGKQSSMTLKKIRALEEIGFQLSMKESASADWYRKYEELKQFCHREGHCNVPTVSGENKRLGMWVANQRKQYKKYLLGDKRSSMNITKKELLDDIGFEIVKKGYTNNVWFKHFDLLKQFKKDMGHCNVPIDYSENKSLGKWAREQRTLYKNVVENKIPRISGLKIRFLEIIGFQWSVKDQNDVIWYEEYGCML